jgi:glyoxylase-like metal-dependent hydrolase (beta-lactamase superfamily II)
MQPVEVAPGVHAVDASLDDAPLEVHVIEGDSLAVVDCGVAGTAPGRLLPALHALGHGPDEVSHVLLTHGHHDHAGGLAELKALAPDAKVLVHPADRAWVEDSDRYVREMYRAVWPAVWSPSANFVADVLTERGVGCPVDGELREDAVVDLGRGHRLRVLEVPGHSPGHVALHDEGADALLVGDAIPGGGNGPGMFPLYASPAELETSFERLRAVGAGTVCTTHHGTVDADGLVALIEGDLDMSRELAGVLRGALEREGSLDPATAVAAVRERWPDRNLGLAICTTVAGHLDALVQDGIASVSGTPSAPLWERRR